MFEAAPPAAVAASTPIASSEEEEFASAFAKATERERAVAAPDRYIDGRLVVWTPQPGSQEEFLSCPLFEALYHGTRGPGKTDALLMDFAQHVGRGYGAAWRGILFRQTYPQLADVIAKSEKWFRRIFPNARLNMQRKAWEWPTGEVLLFRHIRRHEDYWNYHGHEYPWIAWEELTNWPDDRCFRSMVSCCRSSTPGVPRKVRATTNPYGVGHNWVKERYRLHGAWWRTIVVTDSIDMDGDVEPPRAAIHGHLRENKVLLTADPSYAKKIASSASNKAMAAAWLDGRWDVVAGGMFDDVWSSEHNLVPRFRVPRTWKMDRAFDWGSSKPFSVGWYAQSDGSDVVLSNGAVRSTVRGDLFRVGEWYGSTGRPNEGLRMLAVDVAKGIVEREIARGWRDPLTGASRIAPGPADSSIFTTENGRSIAVDMTAPVRIGSNVHPGVTWIPADKRPGSRKAGWEELRALIAAARSEKRGRPRERAGFFVVGEDCPNLLRTLLVLARSEEDPDDVDTDAEDHIADEVRYRIRSLGTQVGSTRTTGYY